MRKNRLIKKCVKLRISLREAPHEEALSDTECFFDKLMRLAGDSQVAGLLADAYPVTRESAQATLDGMLQHLVEGMEPDEARHDSLLLRAAYREDTEAIELLAADSVEIERAIAMASQRSDGLVAEGLLQYHGHKVHCKPDDEVVTGSPMWLFTFLLMSGFDVRMTAKDLDWLAMAWQVRFNKPFRTLRHGDFHYLLYDLYLSSDRRGHSWSEITISDLASVVLRKSDGGSSGHDAMWTDCSIIDPPCELNLACRRLVDSPAWSNPSELQTAFEKLMSWPDAAEYWQFVTEFEELRVELREQECK